MEEKTMEIRDTILKILEDMHADIDFETETSLVGDKILDSFDLVSLVTELSDEFDVKISAKDFVQENFDSLDRLTNLIERLLED